MPLIYHEGYSLGDGAGNNQLLKDTVGWTGKNLLKNKATTQTINGVTFTVNADGSVTANGTATAFAGFRIADKNSFDYKDYIGETLILSGCPANGSISSYKLRYNRASGDYSDDYGEGLNIVPDATYTDSWYIEIAISNGVTVSNLTFYPMLRRADILDDTYEPYHESVETMYEEEIHGVNLFDDSKTEVGTAWNGDTNANRARNIIPCEPNSEYIISMNGTNGLQAVYFSVSTSIPPASQTAITSFPYTIRTGASDKYITLGFNKTSIALSDVTALKIMLRKADIDDSTYRPYNPQAIQNQLNAQGVLGAKNLLSYPYTSVSKTVAGMTYTDNGDGSVTANASTATTNASSFIFKRFNENTLPKGKYIITDEGESITNLYIAVNKENASGEYVGDLTRLGFNGIHKAEFTVDYNGYPQISVMIYCRANVTANNLVFKPMLRLASDPDDTYQPYAMTNRELTEKRFEKRILSSGDDLNNITETGIYHVATSVSNVPENRANLTLIVNGFNSTQIRQVLMTKEAMYTRSKEGATWSSWYKFTGTVVS